MTQAHHDVRIARPIEDVFDFLANGANNPRWQPLVVSTVPDGESLGVGSTFRQTVRHPSATRSRLTTASPNTSAHTDSHSR